MSGFDVIGTRPSRPPLVGGDAPQTGADGGGIDGVEHGGGFGSALEDALLEVSRLGSESKDKAEALARGEPVEIHDLMIAMGKSEVAFNLMLEVRNKIVEAWQTLSRSVV